MVADAVQGGRVSSILLSKRVTKGTVSDEAVTPGKKSATITPVLPRATGLGVRLPVRLHCVPLRAFLALPLLLAVLAGVVLFYPCEIAEGAGRVMVHAGGLGAQVDFAPYRLLVGALLLELPRQVVAPPVQLKVLLPLEPFLAHLAHEPVCRHQALGRQGYYLRVRIWVSGLVSLLFLGSWSWGWRCRCCC